MKVNKDNIIQTQSIEITFDDLDNCIGMQNRIAEVFYEKLQPKMEVLFDELFGKIYYASIDKLEIDCGLLDKKNWEQEFTEQAIRKLKEQLVQVNKKEINHKEIEETNIAEVFLFFLENGFLPWNSRSDSIAQVEEHILINKQLTTVLKKLITKQPKAAERLAYQFSEKFTAEIIATIVEDKKELNEIFTLVKKSASKSNEKHLTDIAILKAYSSDKKDRKQQAVEYVLQKGKEKQELNPESENLSIDKKPVQNSQPEQNKRKSKQDQLTQAIYINNAGLVLLHPFLQTLFQHLKLTEENKWINESSQKLAVLILAFLTTGKEEFEELNLMLNKVLCGIDIDEVVITDQPLSEEIKDECKVLLMNVIEHWSVLKNTSVNGLREAFIQRDGKLSRVANGWLLQVEQKAIDVLLGRLPWGIGLIKLPWMNDMLFTEWA